MALGDCGERGAAAGEAGAAYDAELDSGGAGIRLASGRSAELENQVLFVDDRPFPPKRARLASPRPEASPRVESGRGKRGRGYAQVQLLDTIPAAGMRKRVIAALTG